MDKLRQWVALTVVAMLAVLAGGWFLVIGPKRSEASDLREQAVTQEGANRLLQTKLATLKAQARDLPKQQADLAAVAAKMPDNPALPALIRSMTKAAADAGVELVALAPSAPALVAAPAPAAPAPAATPPANGKTATTATTPAAAAPAAPASTLAQIALSITAVGGYYQVEQFFDRVEGLTRAVKVTGVQLAPGESPLKKTAAAAVLTSTKPSTLTATINAVVYMTTAPLLTPTAGK